MFKKWMIVNLVMVAALVFASVPSKAEVLLQEGYYIDDFDTDKYKTDAVVTNGDSLYLQDGANVGAPLLGKFLSTLGGAPEASLGYHFVTPVPVSGINIGAEAYGVRSQGSFVDFYTSLDGVSWEFKQKAQGSGDLVPVNIDLSGNAAYQGVTEFYVRIVIRPGALGNNDEAQLRWFEVSMVKDYILLQEGYYFDDFETAYKYLTDAVVTNGDSLYRVDIGSLYGSYILSTKGGKPASTLDYHFVTPIPVSGIKIGAEAYGNRTQGSFVEFHTSLDGVSWELKKTVNNPNSAEVIDIDLSAAYQGVTEFYVRIVIRPSVVSGHDDEAQLRWFEVSMKEILLQEGYYFDDFETAYKYKTDAVVTNGDSLYLQDGANVGAPLLGKFLSTLGGKPQATLDYHFVTPVPVSGIKIGAEAYGVRSQGSFVDFYTSLDGVSWEFKQRAQGYGDLVPVNIDLSNVACVAEFYLRIVIKPSGGYNDEAQLRWFEVSMIDKDADEDGYTVCEGDCNDNDATIYPGAPELCDGKDNNCDGVREAFSDAELLAVCEDGRDIVAIACSVDVNDLITVRTTGKQGQGKGEKMSCIAHEATTYVDSLVAAKAICLEDADDIHSCIVSYFASGGKSAHFGEE